MGVGFGAGAQRDSAGLELKNPGPLERVLGLEEGRVHRQRAIEVEGADAEHLVDRHIGIAGSEHLGGGIDGAHPTLDALEFGGCHQVGLVEQDHVGEGDLFAGFIHLVEVLLDVARIDDGHDGVEHELLLEVVVQEEGLRDRAGIGHPGGLDDDVVELVAPLEQLAQDAQQVAAHGAADAAVVGLEDLFFGADDELVVDADLAELVLDHGDALAVVLGKNAVEESGLA